MSVFTLHQLFHMKVQVSLQKFVYQSLQLKFKPKVVMVVKAIKYRSIINNNAIITTKS